MLCFVYEDSQTTTYIKHVDTSWFWLLKALLQINSNSLVIRQKQKKQTNKLPNKIYIWRLSFKTQLQDWVFCSI